MSTALWHRMQQDLQLTGLVERAQFAYPRVVRKRAAHFRKRPEQESEDSIEHDKLVDLV
jgi:hypothetical protein